MSDNKNRRLSELNESELQNIVGGVLTEDAMEWIQQKWEMLNEKSGEFGIEEGQLEEFIKELQENPFSFNLNGLKDYLQMLKERNTHLA